MNVSPARPRVIVGAKLPGKGIRSELAGRNASKADEAARKLSQAVSVRLAAYPTFGPARAAGGHSAHCRGAAEEGYSPQWVESGHLKFVGCLSCTWLRSPH